MTRHRRKLLVQLKSLYLWHRRLGVLAALFMALLAVTGLMLNHTEELELDSRYADSPALLDWYGIKPPRALVSYAAGGMRFSQLGERLFLNDRLLPERITRLQGAVDYHGLLVAAVDGGLLLYTPEGERVERLDGRHGVPSGLQAIGLSRDGRLAVRAAHGDYLADADLISWSDDMPFEAIWSMPSPLPETTAENLRAAWRDHGLPLERVVLDLHSGRIMGRWGVYVMDGVAVLTLILAFSGLWLWVRRKLSERRHRRHRHGHGRKAPG